MEKGKIEMNGRRRKIDKGLKNKRIGENKLLRRNVNEKKKNWKKI